MKTIFCSLTFLFLAVAYTSISASHEIPPVNNESLEDAREAEENNK